MQKMKKDILRNDKNTRKIIEKNGILHIWEQKVDKSVRPNIPVYERIGDKVGKGKSQFGRGT